MKAPSGSADIGDLAEDAAAPSPHEQLELARKKVYEQLLTSGFFSAKVKQETYAGSRSSVTHHLDRYCPKLRASRLYEFSWDKHERSLLAFSPVSRRKVSRRKICATCQADHPARLESMLAILLHRLVIDAMRFQRLMRGEEGAPYFTDMLESLRDIEDTASGVAALVGRAPDRAALAALEQVLRQAEQMVEVFASVFAQQAAAEPVFDVEDEALLASASAAMPVQSYSLLPNRKQRDVGALVSYRSDGEVRLMRGVQELFSSWVSHCRTRPEDEPEAWRPGGVAATDIDPDWVTIEALRTIADWHVEPRAAHSGPWETMVENWRCVAAEQMNVLHRDWCDHYRWVRSAPQGTVTLMVLDDRAEPMTAMASLDRYDLLSKVVGKAAPRSTAHPQLWVVTVPTFVARALDGYSAAGGAVQVASLESFAAEDRLEEVLSLTLSFRDTFSGPQWFSAAASAALSCLT